MSESTIKSVVFDMGGVFVELGPITDIIGEEEISVREFWTGWLRSPSVRAFERGRCSPKEFGDGFVAELGLAMSGDELVRRFAQWPKGLFDGSQEVVSALQAKGIEVSVLSNTNAMHWEGQTDHEIIATMFDHEFTSYTLDMIKPDAKIFEHVIATLGHDPGQILFVDDNQPNVDAAQTLGMDAALTKGIDQVRDVLVSRGLL